MVRRPDIKRQNHWESQLWAGPVVGFPVYCNNWTYMKKNHTLKNNTVVATVMSNMGLDIAMKKIGVEVLKTKVGDRYVMEAMRKGGYNLGGEQSGHLKL